MILADTLWTGFSGVIFGVLIFFVLLGFLIKAWKR